MRRWGMVREGRCRGIWWVVVGKGRKRSRGWVGSLVVLVGYRRLTGKGRKVLLVVVFLYYDEVGMGHWVESFVIARAV